LVCTGAKESSVMAARAVSFFMSYVYRSLAATACK
jgi:hypothetical protein